MNTPVILINRDRLTAPMRLVDQLLLLGYDDLYILDMDSTYPELLDWYDTCKDFTLIRSKNTGHKTLWTDGILKELFGKHQWVAVSDSDIELNQYTPKGFIEDLICIAKDFRVDKCGLSLDIEHIQNPFLRDIIYPIEKPYWRHKVPHLVYECWAAPIDTTFCVVRTDKPFEYKAVRVGGILTATHVDWNMSFENLTNEQQYYFDHADEQVATTKRHYLNWKKQYG